MKSNIKKTKKEITHKSTPKKKTTLKLDTSIALVGMPGAGKSAIARILQKHLNVPVVDSDAEIELASNLTIPEIFEIFGEQYFRDGETRVIKRILSEEPVILATGGGAFINENTRETLLKNTITIWLDVDFATLWKRVKGRTNRPLLNTKNMRETLEKTYAYRRPIYQEAHIHILYDNYTITEMTDIVLENIQTLIQEQKSK